MRNHPFTSASRSGVPGGASSVRRRALLGTAVLVVVVALAGLLAYLTRDDQATMNSPAVQGSQPPSAAAPAGPSATAVPSAAAGRGGLPVAPVTRDPIAFGKAAVAVLWSYDTRAYTQPELVAALHTWMTGETRYADASSVEAQVPSPVMWERMAEQGQFATASVDEAHFPASFTQALQADPGAIAQTYIYAVTATGHQSIGWNGQSAGGVEQRSMTVAVQCRPDHNCALVGVLPTVAP